MRVVKIRMLRQMSCDALKVGRRNKCAHKKLKAVATKDKIRGIALDDLDMYNRDQRMHQLRGAIGQ